MTMITKYFVTSLALLGIATLTGCGKQEAADGAAKPAFEMVVPVTTAKATLGDISQVASFTGSVHWPSRVELRSEISAQVLDIVVREGTAFADQEVLVTLDKRDFELQRDQLAAERAKAQRVIEELKTPTRSEIVDRRRAELAQADSRVVETKDELERVQKLLDQSIRTAADLNRAKANFDSAIAMQSASKAALTEAINGTLPETIRVAESELAILDSRLKVVERSIEKCTIRAPFAGVVLSRAVDPGAYARAGDVVLQVLANTDVEAILQIPEQFIHAFQPGLEVKLRADALPGQSFAAVCVAVIPEADRRTRNLSVRLKLKEAVPGLYDGMYLRTEVPVATAKGVTLVPLDAVTLRDDQRFVFVVVGPTVELRPVTLGLTSPPLVEIRGPVQPGDEVVTTGGEVLFPGVKINIIPPGGLPPPGGAPGAAPAKPGDKPAAPDEKPADKPADTKKP
jgi:HlyD family secretion protein